MKNSAFWISVLVFFLAGFATGAHFNFVDRAVEPVRYQVLQG